MLPEGWRAARVGRVHGAHGVSARRANARGTGVHELAVPLTKIGRFGSYLDHVISAFETKRMGTWILLTFGKVT